MSLGKLVVRLLVEPERHLRAADEDRALNQVRLLHHHVDRFLLRSWQRALLEYRAARADEVEKAVPVDVLLEERAIRRVPVDVALFDVDLLLLQKTSGVTAGGSRRLPVERRFRHGNILSGGTGRQGGMRNDAISLHPHGLRRSGRPR
jgi:hypothetical protein